MFEKVLVFVIFLGPLIFFHELGHFFFARFFGVKVEVFSIGFGPKIFKYLHKGTEYAISIIPLGGYVKMFGDDPFSEVPLSEEEKKVAFNHKSKWARFWIVFGGPLANIILAYFLYVGLLVGGEKVPETKVGVIPETSILYQKGIRTGDVLIGINDEKVMSFDDFNIKGSQVEKVVVKRAGSVTDVSIGMGLESFVSEFVSVVSALRQPVFVNTKGERFVASLISKPEQINFSVEELVSSFAKDVYLYKFESDKDGFKLDYNSEILISTAKSESLVTFLKSVGYYPLDLAIKSVVVSSPADKAGLRMNDILISLNGNPLNHFEDLRNKLQDFKDGEEVLIEAITSAGLVKKKLLPEVKEIDKKKMKVIGIESAVEYAQPNLVVARADGVISAFTGALNRTWDGIVKTFSGYKKLITREVSLNNIGGPLAIGKVASDSLNISLSMFFRLMAIISINLGVINLFPIPVLDGGHIMFLIFETFNKGPLSRRKLEFAQRLGVSVLFFLIFVALFNDFKRLF